MAKSYHIVGILGNMGQRYKAVLEYLGYEVTGSDKRLPYVPDTLRHNLKKAYGIIVATPTSSHLSDIRNLFIYGKPILCEKPLCKSVAELDAFENGYRPNMALVSVVNQYEFMPRGLRGPTMYNYFKTGNDGLAFDCISIIGMATSRPVLQNTSPIWTCQLNGKLLDIKQMDFAYISMIERWTSDPRSNYSFARRSLEKTEDWIKWNENRGGLGSLK